MNKLTKLLGSELMATDTFVRAITHRSAEGKHNERMEFLGDSVLGLIITTELYQRMPRASEGYLSRLRASLVNENALAGIAVELTIGDFLRLGSGELKSGGFRRKSIIADAFEAIVGCIYLEQGMEAAKKFVLTAYGDRLDNLPAEDTLKDPKSRLQEFLQSRGHDLPDYTLIDTQGEAHKQTFTAECVIPKLNIRTTGTSGSRRKAEQEAAGLAFQQVTAK
ncbi:ribonuclease III [Thiothrix subterranea]|uniref:Ribonuclease 3 n=2 Tax=Thiothrix TaxID=1030 RepID=A0AA51R3G1_9GAMM|nr:ribonuclease III [Thiothrix subterranea]MDQ5770157.1 ribonuclease III [Thiothrix subterranea]OQX06309.1 MAG: ribonuclease III [Thiothrix lacustris]WML88899.1 ribonuclease III [Thiothrix subterranea]